MKSLPTMAEIIAFTNMDAVSRAAAMFDRKNSHDAGFLSLPREAQAVVRNRYLQGATQ